MKNITDAPFLKEMCLTAANMYRLGWDERNGGNISYMLDENTVSEYHDIRDVKRVVPIMGGKRGEFRYHASCGKVFYSHRHGQVFQKYGKRSGK